jgi:hypothetical protein
LRYGIAVPRRTDQDFDAFDSDDGRDDDLEPFDQDDDDSDEQTAYCPECGAVVHETADICSKCFTWIDGASRHPPGKLRSRERWNAVVAILLIASMLAGAVLFIFSVF